jgi:hypothetical protein
MADTHFPAVGEIINYVFLFHHEAQHRDEGVKERPCVVVAVDAAKRQVIVAPLTTKGERYPNTLPVPSVVARGASLSGATAVVLDDLNIFTWLGYDVRPLHDTDSVYIGRFPPGFTASIMQKLLAQRPTNRD